MLASKLHLCGAVFCLAALLGNKAWAVVTYAEASADVAGYPTKLEPSVGGASGTSAHAEYIITDGAFTNSTAVANVGTLTLDTWSRAAASTLAAGTARADWADGFVIHAPGYDGSKTGTFSGSVSISGTLTAEFVTQHYARATSLASANLEIGPNTGFNGGNVALQGGGRLSYGTDIDALEGLENFSLTFIDVPFTFDRGIDVSVRLVAASSAVSSGANTYAKASYTLTWEGLNEVRDHSGMRLTEYTAISAASGFDYEHAAVPVPEPSTIWLLLGGGVFVACRILRTRNAQR